MYRFFKINKILSCAPGLLLFLFSAGAAYGAETFSLRPFRPPLMNRISRLLERAQRSRVLSRVDALMKGAELYELLAGAFSPTITVLPPVQKITTPQRDPATIKALSANLLLFPAPFFFNQAQRIAEFVKCARQLDPDFIFLQEIWDNTSMSLLIASFSDYYSAYSPGIGYNYAGLLILSRFPLQTVMARRFAMSFKHSLEELTAQKGMMLVSSEINGKPLYLLNTHLYSASPRSYYRPNLGQFGQIAATVTNLPGRVIIGGDMNLRPEEIDSRLTGNMLRDGCNLPTAGFPSLSQKLDYIMIKPEAGSKGTINGGRVETPLRFSDHNPVFAEIHFDK
ncbi:MAG: hypothetical protein CVV41_06535 [Candidatus Riflebacteria bacterium HGW-Riflebacteria-1]|jgi:exonuclease III|nr:MAG: hypothetical protein CVV41_06535 [Candidatus Riflebacteria bacterium HGW-Riflebacteria-1]